MLFYPALERLRASALVGGCACMSVYSMCSLWCQPCPSGLRSPGSCSPCWVTFLGRARGQSSCLVHLSLPSFFFLPLPFPLAGPLSLTAHAITQWHSFIYYCKPPLSPPNPPHNRGTASVCALLSQWTNFHVSHKNTHGAKMRMLILHTSILGNILFLHEGFSQILYQFHKNEARGWDKCIQENLRAAIRRPFGKASVTVYVSGIWFSNDKIKT